jgi:selenocysteine-specific elongation factor
LDTGDASDRVEEVLRLSGFQSLTELQLCARTGVELDDVPDVLKQLRAQRRWVAVAGTSVFAPPAAVDDLTRRLTRWLERFHRKHPELPGRPVDSVLGWLERMTNRSLARSLLESMVHGGRLKRLGRFACLPAFAPSLTAADGKLMAGMIDAIREGEFHPPALNDLALGPQADRKRRERLATLAAALGQLIQIDPKIYLHPDVEGRLRKRVADLIADRGRVTVADVRETLSSSRKYVVPFLEYLDRIGLTKRTGDHRVLAGNDHD